MTTVQMTVLFSTYNGDPKLPRMLDAMEKQDLDKTLWKIVAVNNNSSDRTQEILEFYKDRLPLEIYFEEKQGKASALDTGFKHLEGDLVVITDDDVIPEPDWLRQYIRIANENPEFDMFAGLILPAWEKEPASWILDWVDLGPIYALNGEIPDGPCIPDVIYGPNSAFRRAILPHQYSVETKQLGPKADVKQYTMGSDTVFAMELAKKGAKAFNTHAAIVRHIIPEQYIREEWILARAERYGLGAPYLNPQWFKQSMFFHGLPVRSLLKFTIMGCFVSFIQALPRSKFRFRYLWNYNFRKGMIGQMRTLYRNGVKWRV